MQKKHSKAVIASLLAATMTVSAEFPAMPVVAVTEGEILGESTFDYKMIPWHTVSASPAKQDFRIEDGAVHITIITGTGAEHMQWDLQFRHRKLNFQAGHTYKVSFTAKSSRDGFLINSFIGDTGAPYQEYCCLKKEGFVQGPHMGGGGQGWGEPVALTTEWQTFEGTFECTEDLRGKEWTFYYAYGEKGNATDGDEIWFDNMSIVDLDGSSVTPPGPYYGVTRLGSGLVNNYISVNQVGYFADGTKTAVLGDDAGNIQYNRQPIKLEDESYTFELVNTSGEVVYTGQTGKKFYDKDSQDNVCRIDFSDYKTPGRYYLRIKGKDWRSFEFNISDNVYTYEKRDDNDKTKDMLTNALNYFYQSRSGKAVEAQYITSGDKDALAHSGTHKGDRAIVQTQWFDDYYSAQDAAETYRSSVIDVTGGWYNAEDYCKSMVEGGMTVWTLQNLYERAAQTESGRKKFEDGSGVCIVPEADNKVPDILDECRYELDFMEKMKVDASEKTWGELAGLYYHQVQDYKPVEIGAKPWNYIEEYEPVRIVKPPTFAATLNYAACAAQAARLWQPYNPDYAAELLKNAKDAYQAYMLHYYEADLTETTHPVYKDRCAREEVNVKSQYAPKYQARAAQPYSDTEVRDDAYWAACEIYISAKTMGDSAAADYLKVLSEYTDAFKVPERITGGENETGEGSLTMLNWGNTGAAGSLSLALHKDLLTDAQQKTLKESILSTADKYIGIANDQGYGIPYLYDGPGYQSPYEGFYSPAYFVGFEFGSNARAVSNMLALAYAYDLTGDAKYFDGVTSGMDYLLGKNPLSFSFVTGYGDYRAQYPHQKFWAYEIDDTLPMAPDGILVAGPTVYVNDPYMRALGFDPWNRYNPSERCYTDDIESWSSNTINLSWNAEFAWLVSFLQEPTDPVPPPAETTTQPVVTTTLEGTPQDFFWGDTNADCKTDVSDAVLLARYLTEDSEAVVTEIGKAQANIVSGKLDSADLTAILMLIAKKITPEQLPLASLPSVR